MEHRMYEDLLKRLHAQELKMRRFHNVVGQPRSNFGFGRNWVL